MEKSQVRDLKRTEDDNSPSKYWKRYEKGRDYIYKKNLISETNKNWNFFCGNQWEGIKSGGEELPMFNFIKPTIKYKVSTISQNNMVANFSDIEGREDNQQIYEKLNSMFSECWEKTNMDLELWSTVKDSAVTGDGIQYYGSGNVEDMQRLPNTNVLYGDESEQDVQRQPYIIIWQRLPISQVKAEARMNGVDEDKLDLIVADNETEDIIGNTDELEKDFSDGGAKVTCIIHMEKKAGVVYVTKCTKHLVYEEEHPIQVTLPTDRDENGIATMPTGKGLSLYPIAKMSWEDYPNDARGVSEVKQLIPNQLEINKTLARRSIIIKLTAYPKLAYDGTIIQNPEDLDKVGTAIELASGGIESVDQAIKYLSPAQTTNDAKNYADDLLENTQELAGAGETAMGNINLNRVAASAVLAVRDQAALPLNEQVAKMKKFVEDLARLWVELLMVYHPDGFDIVVEETDPITGEIQKIPTRITKEEIDSMKPRIRIDTSQDNPWTKEAEQTWLDGVLEKQHITFEEYIEASPDHGIVPKAKMETILERRRAQQQAMAEQQAMQQQQLRQMALNDPNPLPSDAFMDDEDMYNQQAKELA